jgi:ferritin-like metal-binding protein YciE
MSTRPDLKKNIERYLNASRAHMQQLEDMIENMTESLLEDHCRSMRSMIGEAKKLADRCTSEDVKDFAIAASLQRINQCKLNLYESLVRMSDDQGLSRNKEILKDCLKEERFIGKDLRMNTTIKQT